jgi:ATPase subunit of ABC transporter with duplicated ATPase domains
MSQKFITFENNSIVADQKILKKLSELNSDVSIISIVGEARQGKSTFLNLIISYIE